MNCALALEAPPLALHRAHFAHDPAPFTGPRPVPPESRASSAPRPVVMEAVARARAGDAGAFRELYEAHVGRVHALVLRLERDPSTAEELVQDVFVLAWRALSDFRGDAQVSTWLHRIAVNAVLEHHRKTARRERRVTLADDLDLLGASTPAPDAGLDLDLRAALDTLPPGARAVFLLHEVEGYTHEEIAEMTGVTAGTCKTQLFRARRLLRKALDR